MTVLPPLSGVDVYGSFQAKPLFKTFSLMPSAICMSTRIAGIFMRSMVFCAAGVAEAGNKRINRNVCVFREPRNRSRAIRRRGKRGFDALFKRLGVKTNFEREGSERHAGEDQAGRENTCAGGAEPRAALQLLIAFEKHIQIFPKASSII